MYRLCIDPLLRGVRKKVYDLLEHGSSVIDVGCGTGALVFQLANKASSVWGVDVSREMITGARKKQEKQKMRQVHFLALDATGLATLTGHFFDYACLSMVLHQVSLSEGRRFLNELTPLAKTIILADYNWPMPTHWAGKGASLIEKKAGGEHYRNFLTFQEHHGLHYYLANSYWHLQERFHIGLGIIEILKLSKEEKIKS